MAKPIYPGLTIWTDFLLFFFFFCLFCFVLFRFVLFLLAAFLSAHVSFLSLPSSSCPSLWEGCFAESDWWPIRKRLTGGGLTKETDVREGRRDRGTGDLFHKWDASMAFQTSIAPYDSTREKAWTAERRIIHHHSLLLFYIPHSHWHNHLIQAEIGISV